MLNITLKDYQELKGKFGQYFPAEVVRQPKELSLMTHNIILPQPKSNRHRSKKNSIKGN